MNTNKPKNGCNAVNLSSGDHLILKLYHERQQLICFPSRTVGSSIYHSPWQVLALVCLCRFHPHRHDSGAEGGGQSELHPSEEVWHVGGSGPSCALSAGVLLRYRTGAGGGRRAALGHVVSSEVSSETVAHQIQSALFRQRKGDLCFKTTGLFAFIAGVKYIWRTKQLCVFFRLSAASLSV